NSFQGFHSVQMRHRDVKNQHLGLQALRELHCFDSILGLSDNLELAILLQQRPNPLPHQVVVFRQNNPNHSFFLLGILAARRVPLALPDTTCSCPPSSSSRSFIPTRPNPVPGLAASKPWPSSSTRRMTVSSSAQRVTLT